MTDPQLIQAATLAVHLMGKKPFRAVPDEWLGRHCSTPDIARRTRGQGRRGGCLRRNFSPHRASANVVAYTALTLDIEGKDAEDLPPPPEEVADRLRRHNLEGVVYTSHNHLTPPEMNGGEARQPSLSRDCPVVRHAAARRPCPADGRPCRIAGAVGMA